VATVLIICLFAARDARALSVRSRKGSEEARPPLSIGMKNVVCLSALQSVCDAVLSG